MNIIVTGEAGFIGTIYREKDGIVLLYKRLTGSGNYKWACNQDEVKSLIGKQFE